MMNALDDLTVPEQISLEERSRVLELELNPHTRLRLNDPLVRTMLTLAEGIESSYWEEYCSSVPPALDEEIQENVYPLLGNVLLMAFEYINGRISRDELVTTERDLRATGEQFMRQRSPDWSLSLADPFIIPSSVESSQLFSLFDVYREKIQIQYRILQRLLGNS